MSVTYSEGEADEINYISPSLQVVWAVVRYQAAQKSKETRR